MVGKEDTGKIREGLGGLTSRDNISIQPFIYDERSEEMSHVAFKGWKFLKINNRLKDMKNLLVPRIQDIIIH